MVRARTLPRLESSWFESISLEEEDGETDPSGIFCFTVTVHARSASVAHNPFRGGDVVLTGAKAVIGIYMWATLT